MQARRRGSGEDADLAVGRRQLCVFDAQVFSRAAFSVVARPLGVGQEALHLSSEKSIRLDAEEQRYVAAFAKERIAARDGHFSDRQLVERPRLRTRLQRQLSSEPLARVVRARIAIDLIE